MRGLPIALALGLVACEAVEGAAEPGSGKEVVASTDAEVALERRRHSLVVSETTDAVALTIYPDDIALVTERRRVDLPPGRSTIQFNGVSDLIVPQTLILRELSGASLERNFDYDLLGRASLYGESVGRTVRLTRTDPGSGEVIVDEAEIVSADPDNGVIVRTEVGLEGLFCSGLATRASFGGLPPGLAARPAMSVEVETEEAGPQDVVISYLTTGMEWEADYRLDVGEASGLLGWLSVRNGTSKRFEGIDLSVIAGRLNRMGETAQLDMPATFLRAVCWPKGSTKKALTPPPPPPPPPPMMSRFNAAAPQAMMMDFAEDEIVVTGTRVQKAIQEEVGDYKLYRIPRAVTVGAMQTKQIAFVGTPDVGVERRHVYDLEDVYITDVRPVSVRHEIDNSRDGALGVPLPEGVVRVFSRSDAGRAVYLGEDRIDNMPVEEDAKIDTGLSAVLFARAETLGSTEDGSRHRVTFTNAGDESAVLDLESRFWPDARVRGAERVEDKDLPTWRVRVPPEGRAEVTVRLPE